MGKKSKFKQIRRLANQMPVIHTQAVKGSVVKGYEILKEGMKEVDGKPIDAYGNYKKKQIIAAPLNHNRKMKKLYNQYGPAGVGMYINAVNRHVSAQKAKEEKSADVFETESK